jgi:ABC-type antimicrobial peptide transport system permease subunit
VTRALGGLLYGVSPADPLVIGGILGLVLAVAVMAALIPAIRAARVEPMQILRDV